MSAPDRDLSERLHLPGLRHDRIRRERVTALFDADARPIVAVVAPAGSGKTTAVVDWLEAGDAHVCWHTIEPQANDLHTCFAALADAIRPSTGSGRLDGLVASPGEGADVDRLLGSALVEDLAAAPDATTLVIEDLHHLDDPATVSALRFVVDHLPDNVTIVVTSRADPPFPLARLRAAGRVTEVRAVDLAFDRDESAALLAAALGTSVAGEVVDRLNVRIEGWALGLQLAALSLVGRNDIETFVDTFTGSDRYVAEYLIEEVVDREPPEIERFLMETSLVDEMSAALCADITGVAGSAALLDDLVERNLFIVTVGPERFRYHQLFLDLLRARMMRAEPDRTVEVLRSASMWCEQDDDLGHAVQYSLRAGDIDRAADVAIRHGPRLMTTGKIVGHRSLMRLFDDSLVEERPQLLLRRAWGNLFVEGSGLATRDIDRLERSGDVEFVAAIAPQLEVMRSVGAWFSGHAGACRAHSRRGLELLDQDAIGLRGVAHLYAGVGELVVGDAGEAERELDTAAELARQIDNHYAAFSALVATGAVELRRGDLGAARRRFDAALDLVGDMPNSGRDFPIRGSAHLGLGLVEFERFEPDAAAMRFRRALAHLRKTTAADYTALAYRRWAETESLRGRHREVDDILAEARAHLSEFGSVIAASQALDVLEVRDLIRQRNLDDARRRFAETGSVPQRGLREFDHPEFERIATAIELDLAADEPDAAERRLETLSMSGDRRFAAALELACLEASVHHARGRDDQAIDVLEDAVERAAVSGWIRPFLGLGTDVVDLLAECGVGQPCRDLIRQVRDAASTAATAATSAQPLVNPLTSRELEVLGEIAAGFTNAEIAARLFISVGTTKRHVANIFMKLPASHRAEAVARGREAGLLG